LKKKGWLMNVYWKSVDKFPTISIKKIEFSDRQKS